MKALYGRVDEGNLVDVSVPIQMLVNHGQLFLSAAPKVSILHASTYHQVRRFELICD